MNYINKNTQDESYYTRAHLNKTRERCNKKEDERKMVIEKQKHTRIHITIDEKQETKRL